MIHKYSRFIKEIITLVEGVKELEATTMETYLAEEKPKGVIEGLKAIVDVVDELDRIGGRADRGAESHTTAAKGDMAEAAAAAIASGEPFDVEKHRKAITEAVVCDIVGPVTYTDEDGNAKQVEMSPEVLKATMVFYQLGKHQDLEGDNAQALAVMAAMLGKKAELQAAGININYYGGTDARPL